MSLGAGLVPPAIPADGGGRGPGGAVAGFSRSPQSQPRAISPNGKLNHACIGVGGMGAVDLHSFLQPQARADRRPVRRGRQHPRQGGQRWSPARASTRIGASCSQKEGDRIDSVNAAVPDHTHFSIAYSAIQKGKHVYCQKPLCHDVAEVRALTQAAVKQGVVTQLGTQVASTIHDRTGVLWLKEGRIGKITHAYLCSNRPGAVEDLPAQRPAPGRRPATARRR